MTIANEDDEVIGRAKGGHARAEAMSAEERSEIAKKAALARWGSKPPIATHRGSFESDFGIDVDCYVLDDQAKTAVMTQRGIGNALGLSKPGGKDFERFIEGKRISPYLGGDVAERLRQPIEFQWIYPGGKQQSIMIRGYDVTTLIDVCNAVLTAEADGRLLKSQAGIAKQARIILNASAKSGITNLAYALAGYSPATEAVIAAFKLYVLQEAKKYEQEFPNELYMGWHRLYEIPVPLRGKPWQFKHLTVKHIYYPLAKSNGKILELIKALKSKDGDRQKKLFQFLNDLGARALRIQIGRVLEMAESSNSHTEYENKIVERFGGQKELEL